MESIADFRKWIGEMRSELGEHIYIAKQLATTFTENNLQLFRRDEAARLENLNYRINRDVEYIRQMESAAESGHVRGTLLCSVSTFILGSLLVRNTGREDFLKIGAQMARSIWNKTVPFGNVLISIGKDGIPEGVKVVSISSLARESNKSEAEVEASLKHSGYLLMTPEKFAKVLDIVKRGIHNGSVSLPIAIDEIIKQIN